MKFLLFTLSIILLGSFTAKGQANHQDSLKAVEAWLNETDLDLTIQTERFCNSITGKTVSIDSLMRSETSHMRYALNDGLSSLIEQYKGEFPREIIAESIHSRIILKAARECPSFMTQMQAQLVKTIHSMFELNAEQASFLDSVAITCCTCEARDEACYTDNLAKFADKAERLFPPKGSQSAMDQLIMLVKTWVAVGCS